MREIRQVYRAGAVSYTGVTDSDLYFKRSKK